MSTPSCLSSSRNAFFPDIIGTAVLHDCGRNLASWLPKRKRRVAPRLEIGYWGAPQISHQWRRPCLRLHASSPQSAIFDPASWVRSRAKSASLIQSKSSAAFGLALADLASHAFETLAGPCLGHRTL